MGKRVMQRLSYLERKAAALLITAEPLPENARFDQIITLYGEGQEITREEAQRTLRQCGMFDLPDDVLDIVIANLKIANTPPIDTDLAKALSAEIFGTNSQ